jgi:ADP-ribosylglycohydrolase
MLEYLAAAGADPRDGYIPAPEGLPERFGLKESWPRATRGNIKGTPRDDDVDYTILSLHLLERWGTAFTPDQVSENLLLSIPYLRVYTAERVAYRNLRHGLRPPATATYRNPYREWIGALIRADMYGFVSPGQPRRAAELAHRDASTSHTTNGIYAAMWGAALVAEALVREDVGDAVAASLRFVPPRSRLAEALERTVSLHASGIGWEEARVRLEGWYGHYSWVHAIPNAAAIVASLLWGDGDFGNTVGPAVLAGLDTDSAAATAGSVFGALNGARRIPSSWADPLEDQIESAVMGFDGSRISDLAARTYRLASAEA